MNAASILVGSCALLISLASSVPEAVACSPEPPGTIVTFVSPVVPADGVLVIEAVCANCDSLTITPVLKDGDGMEVPLLLVEGGDVGIASFRPETPLAQGESYSLDVLEVIEANSPYVTEPWTVVAGPPRPELPLEMQSEVTATAFFAASAGERVCCGEQYFDTCSSLPSQWCTQVNQDYERAVTLRVDWSLAVEALGDRQMVFKTRFGDDDEFGPERSHLVASKTFSPAESYCYEVYARYLGSSEEQLVTEGCVQHESLVFPDLEEVKAEDLRKGLGYCQEPPIEQMELWCGIFESALAQQSCDVEVTGAACDEALKLCPAFLASLTEHGESTDDEMTDSDSTPTEGGGGAEISDDDEDERSVSATKGGCSFKLSGTPPTGGAGAWAALLVGLICWRRKRTDI